jgi:hypothetical protein
MVVVFVFPLSGVNSCVLGVTRVSLLAACGVKAGGDLIVALDKPA